MYNNKAYLFKKANIIKEEKFTLDSELRKPQGQEQIRSFFILTKQKPQHTV